MLVHVFRVPVQFRISPSNVWCFKTQNLLFSLCYFDFETCCCVKTKFIIIFKLWLGNCVEHYYANIDRQFTGTISSNRISACSCKTGCKTNRCKCRKSGFTCTDLCKCAQCKNNEFFKLLYLSLELKYNLKIYIQV